VTGASWAAVANANVNTATITWPVLGMARLSMQARRMKGVVNLSGGLIAFHPWREHLV
jgi:hypothetical protein